MSRPRAQAPGIGNLTRTLCLTLLGALGFAAESRAQYSQMKPPPPPRDQWYFSAHVGLVGREIRTWNPVHEALQLTDWDQRYPTGCVLDCPRSSELVEGRPLAFTAAARHHLHGRHVQGRLFVSWVSHGYYPGMNNQVNTLTVTPSVATVGAQAAFKVDVFWAAAGPTLYAGKGHTVTNSGTEATGHRSGLGFALSGGAIFPRTGRFFGETSLERRFAGSVHMPALSPPNAPQVREMDIPLSHTLLQVGVGYRM